MYDTHNTCNPCYMLLRILTLNDDGYVDRLGALRVDRFARVNAGVASLQPSNVQNGSLGDDALGRRVDWLPVFRPCVRNGHGIGVRTHRHLELFALDADHGGRRRWHEFRRIWRRQEEKTHFRYIIGIFGAFGARGINGAVIIYSRQRDTLMAVKCMQIK